MPASANKWDWSCASRQKWLSPSSLSISPRQKPRVSPREGAGNQRTVRNHRHRENTGSYEPASGVGTSRTGAKPPPGVCMLVVCPCAPQHGRLGRRQVHEGADGFGCTGSCAHFEPVSEQDEDQQDRRRLVELL